MNAGKQMRASRVTDARVEFEMGEATGLGRHSGCKEEEAGFGVILPLLAGSNWTD